MKICSINVFVILLLILFSKNGIAQDYAVTIKGDTITGVIKITNYGPDKRIQITDAQKNKNVVSIFQTRYFTSEGEKYLPIRTDKGYVFMKLLKEGYLSLYAFQIENQTNFDGRYLMKKDGKGIEVPNLSFKKMMLKYLEECADVTDKINNGSLSKKNLTQIIDSFNECIDKNTIAKKQIVVEQHENKTGLNTWDKLEEKIKSLQDFGEKENALEMIAEIKNKIERGDKIPNFLIEGLKSVLDQTDLKVDLDMAFKGLK